MNASHPLVAEAMKKAAVAWLTVPGRPAQAAWLIWQDDAAYLVHGGPEQPVPGLTEAATCTVGIRGDHGGRIITWPATVERVPPESPEWEQIAPALAQKRLNATDPAGAPARWSTEAVISRLTPSGAALEAGDSLPAASEATAPRPTTATTVTPLPRVLGRRR